ncbi:hypothetical protein AAE045_23240, partial [Dryocola clanedunensis]
VDDIDTGSDVSLVEQCGKASGHITALIAALEQAEQYAKQRDEENQDLTLTIGRLRVEREQLEASKLSVKLPSEYIEMYGTKFYMHAHVVEAIQGAGGSVEGSD